MVAGAAMALILAFGAGAQDTTYSGSSSAGPRIDVARVGVDLGVAADTTVVRRRPRAVRLSEAYYSRNKIHKASAFLMLPSAAYMYASGQQLMLKGRNAPAWATKGHGIGAGVVAGLFTVNTYTGARNWWETRNQEEGLTWRTAHAALMLMSDVGFFVVGQLATPAENSIQTRNLHKSLAIASISMASVSYLMMLKPFRKD